MARPNKPRRLRFNPQVTYFKPRRVPLSTLTEVELQSDELEAIKLCDAEDLNQIAAARRMGISQSTLQRILAAARRKLAQALTQGKAIKLIR